ncbi:MAG: methyltransferase domain-containing protein [bacterium]|nr:methyltransferase domain-containing protein [bacterium]
MTNEAALQKAYKTLSPYSDKQLWEFNNNLVHLNVLRPHLTPEQQIFDAGCGIGILALTLKFLGYNIEGGDKYLFLPDNDFAVAEIQNLQKIWEEQNLRITSRDILDDDLDKKYDVIISIATIEHQKEPKKFLEAMLRNLNENGLIYIATPNVSHLLNRIRGLFGRSQMSGHLENFFKRGDNFEGHWREYTLHELKVMFKWLGLEIAAAENIQSMKPELSFKNLRSVYVDLFRLLSRLLPGTRDTNIIIGRKNNG